MYLTGTAALSSGISAAAKREQLRSEIRQKMNAESEKIHTYRGYIGKTNTAIYHADKAQAGADFMMNDQYIYIRDICEEMSNVEDTLFCKFYFKNVFLKSNCGETTIVNECKVLKNLLLGFQEKLKVHQDRYEELAEEYASI